MNRRLMTAAVALALAVGLLPAMAQSNSEAIQAAEWAVRQAVRERFGSDQRVTFEQSDAVLMSLTEVRVTGTGHTSTGGRWEMERSFKFTVKVRNDGSRTRDLDITFGDGDSHSGSGDWESARPGKDKVHVLRPRSYEQFRSGRVLFEGMAQDDVSIVVYDPRDRRVLDTRVRSDYGRFRKEVELRPGQYRAQIAARGSSNPDEVRFSVGGASGDWGTPEGALTVEQPTRDATVSGPRVTVAGRCSDGLVRVQIETESGRRVTDRTVPVKDNYWNTSVPLEAGSYKVAVRGARRAEERSFRVRSGWDDGGSFRPGKPGRPVDSFVLREPARDGFIRGPRITVSGESSARSVRVQIWDDRGNRITDRNVPTRDNYFNTQVALESGRYRVRAGIDDGRTYADYWFTVKVK